MRFIPNLYASSVILKENIYISFIASFQGSKYLEIKGMHTALILEIPIWPLQPPFDPSAGWGLFLTGGSFAYGG